MMGERPPTERSNDGIQFAGIRDPRASPETADARNRKPVRAVHNAWFYLAHFLQYSDTHPIPMAESENVTTLTDDNFKEEVLEADEPVLVDFWATWCGPCRQIAPVIEDLADEFDGQAKIGKVDVDENPQTAQEYGVRSIPTLLFFKDGEVADKVVGAAGKNPLQKKLEALAGQPA